MDFSRLRDKINRKEEFSHPELLHWLEKFLLTPDQIISRALNQNARWVVIKMASAISKYQAKFLAHASTKREGLKKSFEIANTALQEDIEKALAQKKQITQLKTKVSKLNRNPWLYKCFCSKVQHTQLQLKEHILKEHPFHKAKQIKKKQKVDNDKSQTITDKKQQQFANQMLQKQNQLLTELRGLMQKMKKLESQNQQIKKEQQQAKNREQQMMKTTYFHKKIEIPSVQQQKSSSISKKRQPQSKLQSKDAEKVTPANIRTKQAALQQSRQNVKQKSSRKQKSDKGKLHPKSNIKLQKKQQTQITSDPHLLIAKSVQLKNNINIRQQKKHNSKIFDDESQTKTLAKQITLIQYHNLDQIKQLEPALQTDQRRNINSKPKKLSVTGGSKVLQENQSLTFSKSLKLKHPKQIITAKVEQLQPQLLVQSLLVESNLWNNNKQTLKGRQQSFQLGKTHVKKQQQKNQINLGEKEQKYHQQKNFKKNQSNSQVNQSNQIAFQSISSPEHQKGSNKYGQLNQTSQLRKQINKVPIEFMKNNNSNEMDTEKDIFLQLLSSKNKQQKVVKQNKKQPQPLPVQQKDETQEQQSYYSQQAILQQDLPIHSLKIVYPKGNQQNKQSKAKHKGQQLNILSTKQKQKLSIEQKQQKLQGQQNRSIIKPIQQIKILDYNKLSKKYLKLDIQALQNLDAKQLQQCHNRMVQLYQKTKKQKEAIQKVNKHQENKLLNFLSNDKSSIRGQKDISFLHLNLNGQQQQSGKTKLQQKDKKLGKNSYLENFLKNQEKGKQQKEQKSVIDFESSAREGSDIIQVLTEQAQDDLNYSQTIGYNSKEPQQNPYTGSIKRPKQRQIQVNDSLIESVKFSNHDDYESDFED